MPVPQVQSRNALARRYRDVMRRALLSLPCFQTLLFADLADADLADADLAGANLVGLSSRRLDL